MINNGKRKNNKEKCQKMRKQTVLKKGETESIVNKKSSPERKHPNLITQRRRRLSNDSLRYFKGRIQEGSEKGPLPKDPRRTVQGGCCVSILPLLQRFFFFLSPAPSFGRGSANPARTVKIAHHRLFDS